MEGQDEEPLDPRVQVELDRLNASSEDINRLENKLEETNGLFRSTLSDSTANLKLLSSRLGATVERARPYYEARDAARRTQVECQRAAVQFQRASVLHQNARETIQMAEERFLPRRAQPTQFEFDNAWQEMLNHATMKLLEAERLKTSSEQEHLRRANNFADAQKKLKHLERSLERPIARARPYFEQREVFQHELQRQKAALLQLQRAVAAAKSRYSSSLRELEHISEQIHEQRRLRDLEPEMVAVDLDTCDLGSVSCVAESATSDYEEDFKLSQEQQYWAEMREQIEALSATLPCGLSSPPMAPRLPPPTSPPPSPPSAAVAASEPPLAEELSVARLIARRRSRSAAAERRRSATADRCSSPSDPSVQSAPAPAAAELGVTAEAPAQHPDGTDPAVTPAVGLLSVTSNVWAAVAKAGADGDAGADGVGKCKADGKGSLVERIDTKDTSRALDEDDRSEYKEEESDFEEILQSLETDAKEEKPEGKKEEAKAKEQEAETKKVKAGATVQNVEARDELQPREPDQIAEKAAEEEQKE